MPEPLAGPWYNGGFTNDSSYPDGVTTPYAQYAKASMAGLFSRPTYLLGEFNFGLVGLSGPTSFNIAVGTPLPPQAYYTGIDTIQNQPVLDMPFPWEKMDGQFGQ